MVTYTINGRDELRKTTYQEHSHIPGHVSVYTWFTFLLRHFVRPFQRCLEERRVAGLNFISGHSAQYIPETNTKSHYFTRDTRIHSDKVSKFAYRVIELTEAAPIRRIERVFRRLYIDECQDLVGYDLELIELLMRSNVQVSLVGDHRQATFATHAPQKNRQFAGPNIIKKFEQWKAAGLCEIEYHNFSNRCIQAICDFADQFHPESSQTISKNTSVTRHDGVFAVRERDIDRYVARYHPQPLRYNRNIDCAHGSPINFGASKGMTFDRTLIYPHQKLRKFLSTGKLKDAGQEREKIYVAITRARQSVAFVVHDIAHVIDGVTVFEP
jgi:DNA helicase-2/ATP-dependent DNA helicase PcrA